MRRALMLLEVDREDVEMTEGYLDLLGDGSSVSPGLAQDLMASRLVPLIYERWWRPALGRIAKGLRGPSMAEEYRLASDLLELAEGDVVADVACGPGNFTRRFADEVAATGLAMGFDVSATMLARAVRESNPENVVFVRGDAAQLPLSAGCLDAVGCFAALHLFPDPEAALAGMGRALAPGGRIAVLTSRRAPSALGSTLAPVVERVTGMRMFSEGGIAEVLRGHGMQITAHRTMGVVQVIGARRPAGTGTASR